MLLEDSALTYMQKIKQVLPNWIQMGNFQVIQTESSEATGLLCPRTKAKHKKYMWAYVHSTSQTWLSPGAHALKFSFFLFTTSNSSQDMRIIQSFGNTHAFEV